MSFSAFKHFLGTSLVATLFFLNPLLSINKIDFSLSCDELPKTSWLDKTCQLWFFFPHIISKYKWCSNKTKRVKIKTYWRQSAVCVFVCACIVCISSQSNWDWKIFRSANLYAIALTQSIFEQKCIVDWRSSRQITGTVLFFSYTNECWSWSLFWLIRASNDRGK